MLDSHKIYNTLKASFSPEQAEVLTAVVSEAFLDFSKLVTKQEFSELVEAQRRTNETLSQLTVRINELAEAQRRTDERLEELAVRVNELAEAQRRTEQRLNELAEAQGRTEQRLNELAEAQRRTDERLEELAVRVNELAEAQRRTEQRLNELAEAQGRTEQRLNELAEAQKRTEQQVRELTEAQKNTEKRFNELAEAQRRADERFNALNETVKKLAQELVEMRLQFGAEIKDIRQQLGGLAMAVGYGIEDKVMPYFFDLARKDYGILIKRVDRRNYIYPDGRYDEINIFAEGAKGRKRHVIVAECKAQPSKKDTDRLIEMTERLRNDTKATIYPILIGYMFSPEVESYAKEKYPALRLMKTYEFELNYKFLKKKNSTNKK
jgi:Chromosome segregation ATPases